MRKLLVTGASGFLASRVIQYYASTYEVVGLTHAVFDITNANAVCECIQRESPDLVLHCAAISDVGACAESAEVAWDINVNGTSYLAKACNDMGAMFIFCSSDQVYMGSTSLSPHLETETLYPPHPYGQQKLQAEVEVMSVNPDYICLRLSMMYALDYIGRKEHGNFLQQMIATVRAGKELCYPIYDYRNISNVWDIVKSLEHIFSLPGGIYNIGNEHTGSTWELVHAFLKQYNTSIYIKKNEVAFAQKPRNLRMDTTKLSKKGICLPSAITTLQSEMKGVIELMKG